MDTVFLKILNMSISACWIVLAVLILRFVLKKAPKWISCVLWGIAGLRLIMPFSFESILSLIPSNETISPDIMTQTMPSINTGIPPVNNTVNPVIAGAFSPEPRMSVNPLEIIITAASFIWLAGIGAMLLYTLISYLRLKRKIGTAVLLRDNIYQSEAVASPFVLGIIKPKIYLPFNIKNGDAENVVAHEMTHISRKDHLWKPLGFLILSLHWFNPLVWVGYVLLSRDIELACDEKVIKEMDTEQRADYSQALLTCSVNRRTIAACPLAFGEVGIKDRVKSVLSYKKPAFWIIAVAVIASIATAVCFLTDPLKQNDIREGVYRLSKEIYFNGSYSLIPNYENDRIEIKTEGGMHIYHFTGEVLSTGALYEEVKPDNENFSDLLNNAQMWSDGYNLKDLLKNNQKAWYHKTPDNMGAYPYMLLSQKDGTLFMVFAVFENGAPVTIRYIYELEHTGVSEYESPSANNTAESITLESLKEKYPQFFDVSTDGGLTVYIWQMAENNYRCHLANTSMEAISDHSFAYTVGATMAEMRAILTSYDIDEDDITVQAVTNPLSSYYYELTPEYQKNIKELFWRTIPYVAMTEISPVIDTADFDIDGDGNIESCTLTYGPTSGVFTFVLTVTENGTPEYCNIYNGIPGDMSFESTEEGTVLHLVPQAESDPIDYSFSIKNGNIDLIADGEMLSFWGLQGLALTRPNAQNDIDTAIKKALREKYKPTEPDGLIHIETYIMLSNEEISGTPPMGSTKHIRKEIFYLLVYHMKYTVNGDSPEEYEGNFVPTVLTFDTDENGQYTLAEYWIPSTEDGYESEVRKKFPEAVADNALDAERYAEVLMEKSWAEAYAYLASLNQDS